MSDSPNSGWSLLIPHNIIDENGYFVKNGCIPQRMFGLKCNSVLDFRPSSLKSIPVLRNKFKSGVYTFVYFDSPHWQNVTLQTNWSLRHTDTDSCIAVQLMRRQLMPQNRHKRTDIGKRTNPTINESERAIMTIFCLSFLYERLIKESPNMRVHPKVCTMGITSQSLEKNIERNSLEHQNWDGKEFGDVFLFYYC